MDADGSQLIVGQRVSTCASDADELEPGWQCNLRHSTPNRSGQHWAKPPFKTVPFISLLRADMAQLVTAEAAPARMGEAFAEIAITDRIPLVIVMTSLLPLPL